MDQQHTNGQVTGARAIKFSFEVGASGQFVNIRVAIEDNALGVTRHDLSSLIRLDKLDREPLEVEWQRLMDGAVALVKDRMITGNPLYLALPSMFNGGPEIATGKPTNESPTPAVDRYHDNGKGTCYEEEQQAPCDAACM